MSEATTVATTGSAAPQAGAEAQGADVNESTKENGAFGAERASPGTPSRAKAKEPAQAEKREVAPEQKQAQAPQKPELFEVKVDGKVIKMTRDELIQHASMGHAADRRFKEAAQMRKQAEAVIGKFRDPKQVIAALQDPALGLSKDQIREQFEEWYAKEFIEAEQLTPEQKKLREAEEKLRKYEEDEKQREQEKIKAQQEAMTAEAREQVQKQIIAALEESGLPKTNFTLRRLAFWMARNNAMGFEATPAQLATQVRNEFNTSMRDMVEAADGDVLISLLGDNVIKKLRKYDLEQLRKLRQPQGGSVPIESESNEPKRDRPLTSAEVQDRIRAMQRTGRY
jgi:hypothetical protein